MPVYNKDSPVAWSNWNGFSDLRLLSAAIVCVIFCTVGFRDNPSPQALSSVGGNLVGRATHTKNGRALAATEVEFSNPWCIVYGLRRVLVHRFRVANAIADIKYSNYRDQRPNPGANECDGPNQQLVVSELDYSICVTTVHSDCA